MRVYMRSKSWLLLIGTVVLFSTINVYVLSPYRDNEDVEHHHHVLHNVLDHHDVALAKALVNKMTITPREQSADDHKSPKLTAGILKAGKDDQTASKLTAGILKAGKDDQTASKLTAGILKAGKTCPNLSISYPVEDSQTFQPIAGTKTYVFSAYLDEGVVRIIVLREKTDPRVFACQVWTGSVNSSSSDVTMHVTTGNVRHIPEDHGREYLASYIICGSPPSLKTDDDSAPFAVSVVLKERCAQPSNRLPIRRSQFESPEYNFTLCVSPLNRNFDNTHMLVEMMEFNRLLGAQRFVFYNHSIHPDVAKILHYYKDRGFVDLIQWPSSLPEQAHYFGQLASLNDCLYRYKTRSRYLVYQDLDEFIVPTGSDKNWAQLVDSRLKHNPRFAMFQAQCTFFRKEWPKPYDKFPRNEEANKYRSIVIGHTLREGAILHHGHRSKYIINPKFVETVGIHELWSSKGSNDRLDPKVALLYHYRNWENPNDTQKRVEDTLVVRKYGISLIGSLREAWASIREHTGLTW